MENVVKLKEGTKNSSECEKERSESYKKTIYKHSTGYCIVTEENEPNFKIFAQVLKKLYEQGVRVE